MNDFAQTKRWTSPFYILNVVRVKEFENFLKQAVLQKVVLSIQTSISISKNNMSLSK